MKMSQTCLKVTLLLVSLSAAKLFAGSYFDSVNGNGTTYSSNSVSAPSGAFVEWDGHAGTYGGYASAMVDAPGISAYNYVNPGDSFYETGTTTAAGTVSYVITASGSFAPDQSWTLISISW